MSIKRDADEAVFDDAAHIDQRRNLPARLEGHAIVREQLDWIVGEEPGAGSHGRYCQARPLLLLDCAVGLGEFLESLEGDERFRCSGWDIDRGCAQAAKNRAPSASITTRCAVGGTDYIPPCGFDVVVATALIEHVSDPDRLLKNIHRLTNRWALVMTPNALRPAKIWDAIRGRVRWERKGHLQAWDYHLFRQQLEHHGFKVHRIDVRFVDFPWGHKRSPRLVRWLSYGPLKRWFPMLGSEMFALCEKEAKR